MISGREALSSIDRAILGARGEEDRLVAMLQSLTDEAARLRAQQSEDFRALAATRLDALARDRVVDRLDAAERQALELLDRRREALADAAARRAKATEAAVAAEADHAAKAAAVEAAGDAIDDLTAKVEARIEGDPAWIEQQERISRAETIAKAAADKAAQSEADREGKGKPYENDVLFMYLWRSGYGTSAYRAGPVVRFFDAKVARLVGFDSARPNYHMLTEIPLRLREHADRLAEAVEAERAKGVAVERAALEADGIVPLEQALDATEQALDQAEARLSEAKAELAALNSDESAGSDPHYREALDILTEALGREDTETLYREAMRTPTEADEGIVQSIQERQQAIVRVEDQIQEIRKAAVDLADKQRELGRSRDRFRQSGYDHPLGGFANGDVIGGIIGGILAGALSSRNLDGALEDGFRRRRPRSNTGFGGGLRLPRGGSSRGGGGFRTGGSF